MAFQLCTDTHNLSISVVSRAWLEKGGRSWLNKHACQARHLNKMLALS